MMRWMVWFLFLGLALLQGGCASNEPLPVPAREGVKDLRTLARMPEQGLDLGGEWQFYWQQLRAPSDFNSPSPPPPTGLIPQPRTWRGYATPGGVLPGTGYATYRLVVRFPEGGLPEGAVRFYLREAVSSYRLYLADPAGKLLAPVIEGGTVGPTPTTAVPLYHPGWADLVPKGDVQVILQVSNFVHPRGGTANVELSTPGRMELQKRRQAYLDMGMIGAIALIGLYYLVCYALRPVERAPLWFGLACLLASARTMTLGRHFESLAFDLGGWAWICRLEFFSLYAAIPLLLLFVASLFPTGFSRRVLTLLVGVGAAFAGLVLVTPPLVFGESPAAFQVYALIAAGWVVWSLVRLVRRSGDQTAWFILGSQLITALCAVNDVLHHRQVIQTTYLFSFGVLGMILAMALVLAAHNQRARREVEAYSTKLEDLVRLYESASQEAVTDPLTGLYNRRGFQELFQHALAETRRYRNDLCVLLFDIDHFKRFNDTYGHPAGDAVIRSVAEAVRRTIRDSDVAGRWGGEEFIVLLPRTPLQGGLALAERIRTAVEGMTVENPDGGDLPPVTVSLGVSALRADDVELDTVANRADQALYQAKDGGRNQVRSLELA